MGSAPPISLQLPLFVTEKACTKCGAVKPLSGFYANKNYRDGYTYHCKECLIDAQHRQRERGPSPKRAEAKALLDQGLKRCAHCGEVKALDAFARSSPGLGGRASKCKPCFYDLYEKPSEKRTERQRRWAATHRDWIATYRRTRRLRSLDTFRAREAAWRAARRDEINARARRLWREDPQRRARQKAWADAHRESVRASGRAWAARNREHMKQYAASWRNANRERWRLAKRISQHNRSARIRAAGGRFTQHDIATLFIVQNGRCAYCGAPLETYHVDHKTPVARGGTNWPENLCLSCPSCNWRKNAKSDEEFRALLLEAHTG